MTNLTVVATASMARLWTLEVGRGQRPVDAHGRRSATRAKRGRGKNETTRWEQRAFQARRTGLEPATTGSTGTCGVPTTPSCCSRKVVSEPARSLSARKSAYSFGPVSSQSARTSRAIDAQGPSHARMMGPSLVVSTLGRTASEAPSGAGTSENRAMAGSRIPGDFGMSEHLPASRGPS